MLTEANRSNHVVDKSITRIPSSNACSHQLRRCQHPVEVLHPGSGCHNQLHPSSLQTASRCLHQPLGCRTVSTPEAAFRLTARQLYHAQNGDSLDGHLHWFDQTRTPLSPELDCLLPTATAPLARPESVAGTVDYPDAERVVGGAAVEAAGARLAAPPPATGQRSAVLAAATGDQSSADIELAIRRLTGAELRQLHRLELAKIHRRGSHPPTDRLAISEVEEYAGPGEKPGLDKTSVEVESHRLFKLPGWKRRRLTRVGLLGLSQQRHLRWELLEEDHEVEAGGQQEQLTDYPDHQLYMVSDTPNDPQRDGKQQRCLKQAAGMSSTQLTTPFLHHCATAADLRSASSVCLPPLSSSRFRGRQLRKLLSSPHLPVLAEQSDERGPTGSCRNTAAAGGSHGTSGHSAVPEDLHLLTCLARVDGEPLEQLPPVFVELDILSHRPGDSVDKAGPPPPADRGWTPGLDTAPGASKWSWLETARWVRYEQDYNAVTGTFDQAHSSPLTFQAVVECRRYLEQGAIVLRTASSTEADLPPTCYCQDQEACRQLQTLLAQVRLATARLASQSGASQRDLDLLRHVIGLRHRHVCDTRQGIPLLGGTFPALACITQRIRLRNCDLDGENGSQLTRKSRLRHVNTSVDLHHGMIDHRSQQRTNSVPVMLNRQSEVQPYPEAVDTLLSCSANQDTADKATSTSTSALKQMLSHLTTHLSSSSVASTCRDVELGGVPRPADSYRLANTTAGPTGGQSSHQLSDLAGRLSAATEIVSVQVGIVPGLGKPLLIFLRLGRPVYAPGLTELHGSHPVRFLIIFLGPRRHHVDYCEVGRVFATMMVDKTFRRTAYTAVGRNDLLFGLRSFLDATVVLPMLSEITPTSLLAMHDQIQGFRHNSRYLAETGGRREQWLQSSDCRRGRALLGTCSGTTTASRDSSGLASGVGPGKSTVAGAGGQRSELGPATTAGHLHRVTTTEPLVSLAAATRFRRHLLFDRGQSPLLPEAQDEDAEKAGSGQALAPKPAAYGHARSRCWGGDRSNEGYLLADGLNSESDHYDDSAGCSRDKSCAAVPRCSTYSACCLACGRRCASRAVGKGGGVCSWPLGLALLTDLEAYRHRFLADFVCFRGRSVNGRSGLRVPQMASASSERGVLPGRAATASAAGSASDFSLIFSTVIFLYFVVLAPAVTFGALLNTLVSTSFTIPLCVFASGLTQCLFAVIGGQPLLIVGITGPMLILETCIKLVCEVNSLALGPMRLLIAGYTALLGLGCVLANAGWLVLSVRRSVEEVFNFFVSFYFIFKAMKTLLSALLEVENRSMKSTLRVAGGGSSSENHTSLVDGLVEPLRGQLDNSSNNLIHHRHHQNNNTRAVSPAGLLGGSSSSNVDNLDHQARAMASLLLALVMFTVCVWLQAIKRGRYFRRSMRNGFGYFNVPIGLLVTVTINRLVFPGLNAPTVEMPNSAVGVFPPLSSLVTVPFPGDTVVLTSPRSHGLALLMAICLLPAIATDTVLSGITVAKSERRLRKPSLFSLDLTVTTCLMPLVSGLLGWPFLSPAAVRSNTHVTALTKWNTRTPPGVPHRIVGCVEQRITGFAIGLLLTLSVAVESRIFGLVPMGALHGMFLYMGVMGLRDLTVVRRICALLKRHKHWKDREYLRYLPPNALALFVTVQMTFICLLLALNWVTEFARIGQTSLVFPFILLAFALVREFALTRVCVLAPYLEQMDSLHSLQLPQVSVGIYCRGTSVGNCCSCWSRSSADCSRASPISLSTDVDAGNGVGDDEEKESIDDKNGDVDAFSSTESLTGDESPRVRCTTCCGPSVKQRGVPERAETPFETSSVHCLSPDGASDFTSDWLADRQVARLRQVRSLQSDRTAQTYHHRVSQLRNKPALFRCLTAVTITKRAAAAAVTVPVSRGTCRPDPDDEEGCMAPVGV